MNYGDAVSPTDCWFRNIIDSRWINSDGTIAEQALKGRAIAASPPDQPWSHEMSGRLLSIAPDVVLEGEAFVEKIRNGRPKPSKTLQFSGVAHTYAGLLTSITARNLKTGAYYTPIVDPSEWADVAHSDFTIVGDPNDEDLDEIRTFLQKILRVLPVGGCGSLHLAYSTRAPAVAQSTDSKFTSSSVSVTEISPSNKVS